MYFVSNLAQLFGVYSTYYFLFQQPISAPVWVWIIGIVCTAWGVIALMLLVRNLFIYYTNLESKQDPAILTDFYKGSNRSQDIMAQLFTVTLFIFAILMTPGESKRHKYGWDKE